MRNFNTNQTRHFYFAAKVADAATAPESFDNLDIRLGQTTTGEIYFIYKNADGLVTRTDTVDPKKVVSLKAATTKASASAPFKSMARPLEAIQVKVDTSKITLASYVGKYINLSVTIHGVHDYDMDNSITFVASVLGDSTNTASEGAFYKALAQALVKALPKNDPQFPFVHIILAKAGGDKDVTFASEDSADFISNATSIVIVQGTQKYVKGKLTGEPCLFSIASSCDELVDGKVVGKKDWHKVTLDKSTASNTCGYALPAATFLQAGTSAAVKYYPAAYEISDLEYFALGERGDIFRGNNWPNNYETTYSVNDYTKDYNMLSLEYYWAGNVENVQKSPRVLEICAEAKVSNDVITALYEALEAALAGVASS